VKGHTVTSRTVTSRAATKVVAVVVASLMAITACGSDNPSISSSAAAELETAVADVRAAIEAGDMARAQELLGTLRTTVAELTTIGAVRSDRALEINQAIAELDKQVVENTPTTTTTTTTSTTTTTTRPATTTSTSTTTTTEKPEKGKGRGNKKNNRDDD